MQDTYPIRAMTVVACLDASLFITLMGQLMAARQLNAAQGYFWPAGPTMRTSKRNARQI